MQANDSDTQESTADRPTYSFHREAPAQGGLRYIRCEECGSEAIPPREDRVLHYESCPEAGPMPATDQGDAQAVADALEGLIPVAAADAISPAQGARPEPTVEVVLRAEWDTLPRPVSDTLYNFSYGPVRLRERAPGHLWCLATPR